MNFLPQMKHLVKHQIETKALASRNDGKENEKTINSKMYLRLDNVKISHVSSSFLRSLFMCMFAFWHVAKIYC